jgi:glucosylceramidase
MTKQTDVPETNSDYGCVSAWYTNANQALLFQRQPDIFFTSDDENLKIALGLPVITVDVNQKYQAVDGFGFSLTGGSAMLICGLPNSERKALLYKLFSPITTDEPKQSGSWNESTIGVSFLRLSIGASDLSERCFSYSDSATADYNVQTLEHFDIEAGDVQVIPLLQEILSVNPDIRIIATPWSAPPWMKTNHQFIGGKLRPDCYAIYAQYLVKYLQVMKERGITIHALTPQNEPLNDKNEPSMLMEATEQAEFIKHHLGPALQSAHLDVEVELFCWDHNCDVKEYPLAVFADPQARRYLTGSAWHLYGGDISALSDVYHVYPEMKLYFTEQWVGSDGQFEGDLMWHIKHVLIGSLRNWSSAVLEWNLASDPFCCPHTPGGEARCVGALTIGDKITRNVAYYVIAHASKFIRPGSVRICSSDDEPQQLSNVAFLTPEGKIVLIVLNDDSESKTFHITFQEQRATVTLFARTVATYVW